ncbi:hypothetical protein JTE90_028871 [Oedothorax gibbosus]|uniref:Class II aldolase/adducin N-terminal domain-containing protein n=1 Tax=Oedothorax gibbosus TaxID=931172 RepID=A0AAV6U9K2_9ARAC|nr:hypothetical protein JTE90_028871 [Oedothorax gibbosus]
MKFEDRGLESTMAETEDETNGIMLENGPVVCYDPDDPENEKQMLRPPDIHEDVKEMERRKRVDMIMNSQVFREELERIIESQICEGLPANLAALQQVTELLLPNRRATNARSGHCVIPINDIRGDTNLEERLLRCKLAACYRLVDINGWSENIYNHITVRVCEDLEHFLLNPFGLQYPEVTASSLIKVDMQGNVIDPGTTSFNFNRAGFVLHSAIHAARSDVRCCIHVHHPPVVAVSAMKCGLLPISQESALIGDISYHDYHGIVVDTQERQQIARDLGPINKVLLLRNHGVVVLGDSIEEALFYLQNLVQACETQVKLMPIGLDNIQLISEDARQKVRSLITSNQSSVTGKPEHVEEDQDHQKASKKFKVWDLEFEAQMRMLDNSLMEGKKGHEKLRWVNSPNVYQKVEVLENGTSDPKQITKFPSPVSPCSDEEVNKSGGSVQRSLSARLSVEAAEELRETSFQRRTFSERKPKSTTTADMTLNGEKLRSESGEVSQVSRSSKESSPVKEVGDDKKDKKKKKGLRTPSFLKKKKHKKEKEDKEKVAS